MIAPRDKIYVVIIVVLKLSIFEWSFICLSFVTSFYLPKSVAPSAGDNCSNFSCIVPPIFFILFI